MLALDDARAEFIHHDPVTASAYMRDRLAPHRLRTKQGSFDARFRSIDIGSVVLLDIVYGSEVEIEADAYDDLYFVHAVMIGRGVAEAGSNRYEARPANLLISDPKQRARLKWEKESRHLTLRIQRDVMETRLRDLLNNNIGEALAFKMDVVDDLPLSAMWRSTVAHVYQQCVDFPQFFGMPHIGGMYQNILIDLLLLHHEHNYSDELRSGVGSVCPWHVRKAKQYIDHLIDADAFDSDELRIEAIAAYCGISSRTLQATFVRFVGETPLKYILHRKIERLHQALKTSRNAKRVTDVMIELGISNFGRYAGYYKRRYGVSPSQTMRGRSLS